MANPQLPLTSSSTPPTTYFGYGSNLWLHQMATRCPTSTYLGVARLPNHHWIINDRGYANVVDSTDQQNTSTSSSPSSISSSLDNVVFGLVYALQPEDEKRLDRNEGVPLAYTKETFKCDFWPSDVDHKVDTSEEDPEEKKDMLVYIDRNRITPDKPRDEYVYRMNQGIADAVKLGVPEGYVRDVMRRYIPAEEDHEGKEGEGERESIAEFAREQAAEFRDESGVFQ